MIVHKLLLFATLAVAGCVTANSLEAVKTRAKNDMNCAPNDIVVTEIGNHAYKAEGCNKKATYTTNRCWAGDFEGCTARLDSISDDQQR